MFQISSKKKIVLISIKKNLKNSDVESLGAEFFIHINHERKVPITFILIV